MIRRYNNGANTIQTVAVDGCKLHVPPQFLQGQTSGRTPLLAEDNDIYYIIYIYDIYISDLHLGHLGDPFIQSN